MSPRLLVLAVVVLGLGVTAKGRLAYSCREEYRRLFVNLVEDQSLTVAAARLLIARLTVFEDAANAARCLPRPRSANTH